ncbi:hypothetical protein CRENBAI_002348 [Crenichthys baileyi]|uniref:Uncharacterized protein n=1 Tax=Crenichthys baileyi TaxID=28760 RepID=A0AAV9R7H6_9TELE
MSEMMKIEADDPGGFNLVPPTLPASTLELEQRQDSKELIHQMLVIKEEVPQDWSSSLDRQDPAPPHIKVEEEELWISREEDQLTVKSEDGEKPQLSELYKIKTEDNRETNAPTGSSTGQMETKPDEGDCGESEPDKTPDPEGFFQQSEMTVQKRVVVSFDTSPTLHADGGQRARWCRLYGSLTSVSLPQGGCGYNVAHHCQCV